MTDSIVMSVKAAQRGLGIMSYAQSYEATRAAWKAYRGAANGGNGVAAGERLAIMRPVFVASTQAEAEAVMRPALNRMMTHGFRANAPGARKAFLAVDEELTEQDGKDDAFDFLNRHEQCFVGTPDVVTERIKKFQTEINCEHLTMHWAMPLIQFPQYIESLKLFADKVMPNF
jgi:alkanesulfonate monooxygenase SsuD/methylene tetrahydromethanopterin reductase-like flavin-dependent oxidoreductase (luciferase family)